MAVVLTDAEYADFIAMRRWWTRFSAPNSSSNPATGVSLGRGNTEAERRANRRGTVLVKVTSAASGGGCYNGRVFDPPATLVAGTATLAESHMGTEPGADNAIVMNSAEVGKTTHDLTNGTPVAKVFVGVLLGVNTNGRQLVAINGVDWEDCATS